jgi:hypothetical protein
VRGWYPISNYFLSVESATYIFKNPKRIPFRKKEMNFDGYEITKFESDSQMRYSLKNQKAIKYENYAISSREILPQLKIALNQFSLKGVKGQASNWKEFGIWMHDKLIKDRGILDEATKIKVLKLVEGVSDPIEKTKIVYQYMQDKTRYISVQIGIGGWEPIAANKVDKVGYGDCKGLSNYTKALLDVVGVKSYFTVVYAQQKRNIDKDFTSLQGNHAILNVPIKNAEDIWLECTSQTAPFGFLGSFTEDRDVLEITPEGV